MTRRAEKQPLHSLVVNGNSIDAGVVGRDGGVGTVIQNGGTFSFNIPNNPRLFICASANTNSRGAYFMNGGVLDMNNNILSPGLGANGAAVTGLVSQVGGVITNVGQLTPGWNSGQNGRGIYRTSPDVVGPSVTVTSPAGGEMWEPSSSQLITWNAADAAGIDSVTILLSINGGASYDSTVASGIPNAGSLAWTTPHANLPDCKIRIVAWDAWRNSSSSSGNDGARTAPCT